MANGLNLPFFTNFFRSQYFWIASLVSRFVNFYIFRNELPVILVGRNHIHFVTFFLSHLGQGANQLTLDGLTSHKNVTVKSGKGDDTIAIKNAGFGAGASIKAGAGTNAITFTGDDFPGDLTVVTGNGNDTIDTTGATVHGTTKIQHGKGTDVVTP